MEVVTKIPWYDCIKGIEEHLSSIKELNDLASARYEAGYNRNEILSEWCILGFIFTDSAGNFSLITQGAPADGCFKNCVPPVISRKDMFTYTNAFTATFTSAIPSVTDICELCKSNWNISNIRDYFHTGQNTRHLSCHRKNIIDKTISRLTNLIIKAEIKFTKIEPVPNEYCLDENFFGPWIIVHTDHGHIKLGDRKRVYEIDWSGIKRNISSNIFVNENVTKSDFFIHAWSDEDAIKYLKKIWNLASH